MIESKSADANTAARLVSLCKIMEGQHNVPSQLSISDEDRCQMLEYILCAQYILENKKLKLAPEELRDFMFLEESRKFASIFEIDQIIEQPEEIYKLLLHLCRFMSSENAHPWLDAFERICPYPVYCYREYLQICAGGKLASSAVLYTILKYYPMGQVPHFMQHPALFDYLAETWGIDFADFLNLCALSVGVPCNQNMKSIPLRMKVFLEEAATAKIEVTEVLRDYQIVREEKGLYRTLAQHRRAVDQDQRLENRPRSYLDALTRIRVDSPSDVLQATFEWRTPNLIFNAATISLFLCNQLFQKIEHEKASNVLIVCPNPSFLEVFSTTFTDAPMNILTKSEVERDLYALQYPNAKISLVGAGSLPDDAPYVAGVIFSEKLKAEELQWLLQSMADQAFIAMLSPQTIFSRGEGVDAILSPCGVCLDQVIELPNEMSICECKKTAVLFCSKRKKCTVSMLYTSTCFNEYFSVVREPLIFHPQEYKRKRTIRQLQNDISAQLLRPNKEKRERSKKYKFSIEISFRYAPLADRHGKLSAKVHYVPQSSKWYSKYRSFLWSEAGFRCDTEYQLKSRLELYVLREDNETVIREDVVEFLREQIREASLKTIWFVLRPKLKSQPQYDDDFCINQFSGEAGTNPLADLRPAFCTAQDFEEILEKENLKVWKQLDLILRVAYSNLIIKENPLKNVAAMIQDQEYWMYRNARNALGKASGTREEQARILQRICKKCSETNLPLPVVDARYMAAAIRFFSGISRREVLALRWRNLVSVDGLGFKTLLVMEHMNDRNEPISNSAYKDGRRHRKIPVVSFLERLLTQRWDYLLSTSMLTANELLCSFICAEDVSTKGCSSRKHVVSTPLSSSRLYDAEREIFAAAEFSTQVVRVHKEVDLNKYQGNWFFANLRHHAIHEGKLDEGALSYISGKQPSSTFADHYCDYSAALSQLKIFLSLECWARSFSWVLVNETATRDTVCTVSVDISPQQETTEIWIENKYGVKIESWPKLCSSNTAKKTDKEEGLCND